MCGRFLNTVSNEELGGIFGTTVIGDPLPVPSWHIHPTDPVRFVLDSKKTDERRLESAVWTLARPHQPSLSGRPVFNVRAESAEQKFGYALKASRGLMPADGYFEWRTDETGKKYPHYIYPENGVLAFAALYSWWVDPKLPADDPARWTLTAAILTMDAAPHLAPIHDRNPVVLPPEFWDDWLDPNLEGDQTLVDAALAAAKPVADALSYREVRPFGSKDEGPQLIEPA